MNGAFRLFRRQLTYRTVPSRFASHVRNIGLSDDDKSLLNEACSNKSNEYWQNIRQQFIETNRRVSKMNVDGLILKHFESQRDVDTAKSFLQYLEESNQEISPIIKGILLRVYYAACSNDGYNLSEEDTAQIIAIYKELREKYEIFDAVTCGNLAMGLSLTPQWKEGLQLLEEETFKESPDRHPYCALVESALKYDDLTTVIQVMRKIVVECHQNPIPRLYDRWIDWCLTKDDFKTHIETLFTFLEENEVMLPKESALALVQSLRRKQIRANVTQLKSGGLCGTCKKHLSRVAVTTEEFNQIRDTFISKVLVRNNVYVKSDPQELQRFIEFINTKEPYDMVIDGLNVAYTRGISQSKKSRSYAIRNVVINLSKTHKRILVLGREHMKEWPLMDKLEELADVFYLENLSQDDPYILYSALKSGPDTCFCSRDLMRGHGWLLGTNLCKSFIKWRDQHQFKLKWLQDSEYVFFIKPCLHKTFTHKMENVWHVPFVEQLNPQLEEHMEFTDKKWLCVQL